MNRVMLAIKAAACCFALAAGVVHGDDPPAETPPAQPPADSGLVNRTRVSLGLSLPDPATGEDGRSVPVAHSESKAWAARVSQSNPHNPAAGEGVAVAGCGPGNDIYGFDIETGKRKWNTRSRDAGISSIVAAGDSAYYTTASCTFERVRLLDGRMVYSRWIASVVDCAPDIDGERAYTAFGGRVLAHSTGTGIESWGIDATDRVITGPVASNGKVFVASVNGDLACYEGSTGALAWRRPVGAVAAPVPCPQGVVLTTAAIASDVAAAPGPDADSSKARRADRETVTERADKNAPGKTLAVKGNQRVALFRPGVRPDGGADRKLKGTPGSGLDYQGPLPGVSGKTCVVAMGNQVRCIDLASCTQRWTRTVETRYGNWCRPVIGEGLVILADSYGFVTALDEQTGALAWSYRTLSHSFAAAPALHKGRVLLTTADGLLVCIPLAAKPGGVETRSAFAEASESRGGVAAPADVPQNARRTPDAEGAPPRDAWENPTPIEQPEKEPAPAPLPPPQPPPPQPDPVEYEGKGLPVARPTKKQNPWESRNDDRR